MDLILGFILKIIPFLSFLIVLTICSIIIDIGRLILARWWGEHVQYISIGFGRVLLDKLDNHHTYWCLRVVPLFTSISYSSQNQSLTNFPAIRRRFAITHGGTLLAFALSFLLLFSAKVIFGQHTLIPVLEIVYPNTPAEKAGLLKSDRITAINDIKVETYKDVQEKIGNSEGPTLTLSILRNSEKKTIIVQMDGINTKPRKIGIGAKYSPETIIHTPVKLPEAFSSSVRDVYWITQDIWGMAMEYFRSDYVYNSKYTFILPSNLFQQPVVTSIMQIQLFFAFFLGGLAALNLVIQTLLILIQAIWALFRYRKSYR